jgi:hypothetical protein
MKVQRIALIVLLLFLVACMGKSPVGVTTLARKAEAPPAPAAGPVADKEMAASGEARDESGIAQGGEGEQNALPVAARGRKLIREGNVALRVHELEQARAKLESMVNAAGGFIADVKFNRYADSSRMELTLRLPADGFTNFVKSLAALGVVENEETKTQDVTDQWIDLDRRIETNEKLSRRLEDLIQNKSYAFRDLLEVERELARLRLDTERLQGSLRVLDDRVSLSTLHVTMRQEVFKTAVAPESVFAPLVNALESAWPHLQSSLRVMMQAAGGLVTLVVVMLPWWILIAVVVAVVVALVKRSRRKRQGK